MGGGEARARVWSLDEAVAGGRERKRKGQSTTRWEGRVEGRVTNLQCKIITN